MALSHMVFTFFSRLLLVALLAPLAFTSSANAIEPEGWVDCLYNNSKLRCRRTFLCSNAPCSRFKLEWSDGVSDVYTLSRDVGRNLAYYNDPRGGEWLLRGFAGSFALVNQSTGNTVIYDMTLQSCRQSGLSDLCGR